MPSTELKPWNNEFTELEQVYTDHYTADRSKPCMLKFKSTEKRTPMWFIAFRECYPRGRWDPPKTEGVQMLKVTNNSDGYITVKIHHTTSVITIQGKDAESHWLPRFQTLQSRVDELENNSRTSSYDDDEFSPQKKTEGKSVSDESIMIEDDTFVTQTPSSGIAESGTPIRPVINPYSAATEPDSATNHPECINAISGTKSSSELIVLQGKSGSGGSSSQREDELPDPKSQAILNDQTENNQYADLKNDSLTSDHDSSEQCVSDLIELIENKQESMRSFVTDQIDTLKNEMMTEIDSLNWKFESARTEILIKERDEYKIKYETLLMENGRYKQEIMILKRDNEAIKRDSEYLQNQLKLAKKSPPSEPAFAFNSRYVAPVITASPIRSRVAEGATAESRRRSSFIHPPAAEHSVKSDEDSPGSDAESSSDDETADNGGAGDVSSRQVTEQPEQPTHPAEQRDREPENMTHQADSHGQSTETESVSHGSATTGFSQHQAQRTPRNAALMRTESLVLCDSTPQHIDKKMFMGQLQVFIDRASDTNKAKVQVDSYPTSDNMKYATVHEGVNDITNGISPCEIIANIKYILDKMKTKFPNAKVAFSEILYIGRGNHESAQNSKITEVNKEIKKYCTANSIIYITHESLNNPTCPLFRDDKHPNDQGGTAVLVADIYNATGYRRQSRSHNHVKSQTFWNSNAATISGDMKALGQIPKFQMNNVNPDDLMKVMCMSFLHKYM